MQHFRYHKSKSFRLLREIRLSRTVFLPIILCPHVRAVGFSEQEPKTQYCLEKKKDSRLARTSRRTAGKNSRATLLFSAPRRTVQHCTAVLHPGAAPVVPLPPRPLGRSQVCCAHGPLLFVVLVFVTCDCVAPSLSPSSELSSSCAVAQFHAYFILPLRLLVVTQYCSRLEAHIVARYRLRRK